LYLTRAPDYAQLKMEVDGQASSPAPDGLAPKVMPPGPMQTDILWASTGSGCIRPGLE